MTKPNLKGLTLSELEDFAVSIGEQKFRGKQLFNWLYTKEVSSFGEMSSLSKSLREKLPSVARIDSLKLIEAQTSRRDGTTKFLFELHDGPPAEAQRAQAGTRIESVLIPPRTAFKDAPAMEE